MPISGLLVTLASDHALADAARQAIGNDKLIELGVCDGRKLAAVIDAPDANEDRRVRAWLDELPGVVYTDVVFIAFDVDEAPVTGDPPNRRIKPESPR